jgi:hypothetical protein
MTVTGKPQKFMMRQQMMNELNFAGSQGNANRS